MQKHWMLVLLMILMMLGMSSCATFPFRSSEEALRSRVEEMMNARMDDDWEKVYTYLDPAYQRRISKKDFMNIRREMDYTRYSIESIEIGPSGNDAVVKVRQDVNVKIFDFKNQSETQNWIKDGWTWYLKVAD